MLDKQMRLWSHSCGCLNSRKVSKGSLGFTVHSVYCFELRRNVNHPCFDSALELSRRKRQTFPYFSFTWQAMRAHGYSKREIWQHLSLTARGVNNLKILVKLNYQKYVFFLHSISFSGKEIER